MHIRRVDYRLPTVHGIINACVYVCVHVSVSARLVPVSTGWSGSHPLFDPVLSQVRYVCTVSRAALGWLPRGLGCTGSQLQQFNWGLSCQDAKTPSRDPLQAGFPFWASAFCIASPANGLLSLSHDWPAPTVTLAQLINVTMPKQPANLQYQEFQDTTSSVFVFTRHGMALAVTCHLSPSRHNADPAVMIPQLLHGHVHRLSIHAVHKVVG